jgi:hypothetical protein
MKNQPERVGSLLLPAIALVWFVLIVVGNTFGHEYFVDGKVAVETTAQSVVREVGPTLAAAGVVKGDALDRSRLSLALWFRANGMTPQGQPVVLAVVHDGAVRMVVAPAVRLSREMPVWENVLNLITAAFSLGLLAVVGYRRPSVSVALLIFFVGGAMLSWPHFMALVANLPDAVFTPLAYVMRTLCGLFPVMLLASFAIRLGADNSARRRTVVHIVDGIVVLGFLTDGFVYGGNAYSIQIALTAVLLLVAACVSLVWAKPRERNRVALVFAAIMVGGVGYAVTMLLNNLGLNFTLFILYTGLSVLLIPLALSYAILRHRIFDITFVLNRTIVYATTSALLLIIFAALEFGAERYLTQLTHIASVIVEFLIALAVIVSARLVHSRVDRFVDAVLFRTRHEQELALRRFATTVQFYTEQRPLVRDAVDVLERYGSVTGVAIYLTGGGTLERVASSWHEAPLVVDENDLGYVELRAHRQTLDLHHVTTSLPGARLYPMTLSGRLVGAVAVGERHGAEQMPPDIDESIERVAESIAISIAAIETDAVRQENALLQQRLNALAPAN